MNKTTLNRWLIKGSIVLSLLGGNALAQTPLVRTGLVYTPAASRQNNGDRSIEATLLRYFRVARNVQRRSTTMVNLRNRHLSRENFGERDADTSYRISLTLGLLSNDRINPNFLPSNINGIQDRKRIDLMQICTAGHPGERFSGITRLGASRTAINGGVLDMIPAISAHEWGHCMFATHAMATTVRGRGTVMREGRIRNYSDPAVRFRGQAIGSSTRNNASVVRRERFNTANNRR